MVRRKKEEKYLSDEEPEDHDFQDEVDDTPPSIDPYEVLGIGANATAEDVRKAYRKLALKHHPDKAPESDKSAANKKFQEIAFAYAVLSDERRRKRYDLTGSTAETIEDDEDFDWLSFYREQFEDIVNEESIKRIASEYKGSEQEKEDLLKAYVKHKGNLARIYNTVMLSDILEDDDRFRKIIDEAIDKGEVENYPAYESENKDAIREKAKEAERKRREEFVKNYGTSKEAAEKAKLKQKSKGKKDAEGDLGDLAALIQQRQRARMGNLFDKLEEKYAPKSRGTKRATPMDDEPTEEEFQATRKRLAAQSKSRRSTKKVVESDHEEEEGLDDEEDIDLESEEKATPPPKARKQARRGLSRGRGGARAKA